MSLLHRINYLLIRTGKPIARLILEFSGILLLVVLSLIFTRWLVYH